MMIHHMHFGKILPAWIPQAALQPGAPFGVPPVSAPVPAPAPAPSAKSAAVAALAAQSPGEASVTQEECQGGVELRLVKSYPLVVTNIAMENHHFQWEHPL